MSHHRQARSISRAVVSRLPDNPAAGLVLAAFDRACLLAPSGSSGREPIALVLREVGDGPLNVVVEGKPGAFGHLSPGTPVNLARDQLRVGALTVNLTGVPTWEPRPDWQLLRPSWPRIRPNFQRLRDAALQAAPPGSLLSLLDRENAVWQPERRATLLRARQAAEALAAGWAGDGQALVRGARHLAGLGGGLTPAGDDLLAGFMLRAWLAHPRPDDLCHDVSMAAAPRTTTLSTAFLHAAARGECSAPWHTLLYAMTTGESGIMMKAMTRVLAHGHTSGADTLAGFLWEVRDVIL